MSSSYVPLWVKSCFSFLEGASHPEELVEAAHKLGLPAIALADRVAIIEAGRIVELGSHDELMALGGRYAVIVAHQNG